MIRQFFHSHDHDHEARHGMRGFRRGFEHRFGREFARGFGGGPGRARRGDVKFLVLELLTDSPRHGYDIIGAIEERRGFRPSPGSIYPTLQMLEDGGFVTSTEVEGKRVYTITDSGRELLSSRAADTGDDADEELEARHRLKASAIKLGAAVMGVRGSDDATLDKVRTILDRARKEIYGILATDEA
jgi:DNA-binding PadR family transcriptional regulator